MFAEMPQTPRSKQKLILNLASTISDSFPLLTLLDVPVGYAHDAPPAVAAHKVRAAGVVEQGQRGVDGGAEGHLEGSRNERALVSKKSAGEREKKEGKVQFWQIGRIEERGRRKKKVDQK